MDRLSAFKSPDYGIMAGDTALLALLKGHEAQYPRALAERYPQIVNRIIAVWSSPATARTYFQSLLMTDRNSRQGFSSDVYSEILALAALYDKMHPAKPSKPVASDPWESGGGGRIR